MGSTHGSKRAMGPLGTPPPQRGHLPPHRDKMEVRLNPTKCRGAWKPRRSWSRRPLLQRRNPAWARLGTVRQAQLRLAFFLALGSQKRLVNRYRAVYQNRRTFGLPCRRPGPEELFSFLLCPAIRTLTAGRTVVRKCAYLRTVKYAPVTSLRHRPDKRPTPTCRRRSS
jgi:hypothetical protein